MKIHWNTYDMRCDDLDSPYFGEFCYMPYLVENYCLKDGETLEDSSFTIELTDEIRQGCIDASPVEFREAIAEQLNDLTYIHIFIDVSEQGKFTVQSFVD